MSTSTPKLAALILAAGQGTRMKSTRAKVLFEVGGAPMIAWPVRRALNLGADPVVVVVGHEADAVKAALDTRFPGRIRTALQAERLGTGHAAKVGLDAIENFEGVVMILYGDVPLLEAQSLEALRSQVRSTHPVAVMTTRLQDPTGYGRIVRRADGQVVRIVEHKDATEAERALDEVNAGLYAVEAGFLRSALARLRNDNQQSEYYLTDIVDIALQDKLHVSAHVVAPAEVQGANTRAQLAELETLARTRTLHRHMEAGVTIIDPATTYIESEVEIGPETVVHPGVHLRGRTRIGRDCTIDVGSILTDAELNDEVCVHPYSILEGASVGRGCSVGPFARLRPQAELGEGAKVGNFVEVKKSSLGAGAKANHLAYIGDAQVGAGSNVGAGTITCNYDGVGKHQTVLGEGVFVGSNSTLVAPLKVGDGSYVGAGSVLTDPVPDQALALGRARQITKPGRAPAVRAAAEAKKAAKPQP